MNKESGLAKREFMIVNNKTNTPPLPKSPTNVQKRWKQGEMLQRRNTETLSRQARMMLGMPKLDCHRGWRETRPQELPLLHGKNKQGKYRFAAD